MRFQTTRTTRTFRLLAIAAFAALAMAGCQINRSSGPVSSPTPTVAAPPAGKVTFSGSYANNIQPIFTQHCVSCHGADKADNGLRLDSYEATMKGTQNGPIVVPGSPSTSALISVVRGTADPSIRMPHGGARLTTQEVDNISLWIEAGAKQ